MTCGPGLSKTMTKKINNTKKKRNERNLSREGHF